MKKETKRLFELPPDEPLLSRIGVDGWYIDRKKSRQEAILAARKANLTPNHINLRKALKGSLK